MISTGYPTIIFIFEAIKYSSLKIHDNKMNIAKNQCQLYLETKDSLYPRVIRVNVVLVLNSYYDEN